MSALCGHPLLPITRSEAPDSTAASGRCLLADSNLSPAVTSRVPDLWECHEKSGRQLHLHLPSLTASLSQPVWHHCHHWCHTNVALIRHHKTRLFLGYGNAKIISWYIIKTCNRKGRQERNMERVHREIRWENREEWGAVWERRQWHVHCKIIPKQRHNEKGTKLKTVFKNELTHYLLTA